MMQTKTIRGPFGVKGVHIGVSPSGVSWTRWLRPGELVTSRKVQDDVRKMSARLAALLEGRKR